MKDNMPKIEVMSETLSNKIAAGEVIERPASVIKELVENSIDASSTRIEVYVEEGGLTRIKVIDNGSGMDQADASLAFGRHATSKLKSDKDLFQITTLGFRGEALPSIASVSHVTLQTWDGQSEAGTEVRLEGGKIVSISDAPLRQGTRIEVSDLFYNTPARYKYLKSIHTELSHVSDYMNRLALAHPQIAFQLTHNGRELLSTNGRGDQLQVLAAIYGPSMAKQMLPFKAQHIDFDISGYLAKPEITRSNRSYISIIINGRYLRNYSLNQAILKAYHTLLPVNRYPIVLLAIRMDPSLLDINVHPAKLEARISKEAELVAWLEEELKKVLHQAELIPSPLRQLKIKQPVVVQETLDLRLPTQHRDRMEMSKGAQKIDHENTHETFNIIDQEDAYYRHQEDRQVEKETAEINKQAGQRTEEKDEQVKPLADIDEKPETVAGADERAIQGPQSEYVSDPNRMSAKIPLLAPLGQLHGTYILAQNEEGLYMIDQHAAQERIWYEHFYEKLNHPPRTNQELLLPLVLEFTASEFELLGEHRAFLEHIGLKFEEFGYHSYRLRSHPNWFPEGEEEDLIREIIDLITRQKKQLEWIYFREKVAIMMSCKQAIKANHYLTFAEMEALLEQLRTSSNPFTCPHGRPITVLLSTYDIEKMFKRVM